MKKLYKWEKQVRIEDFIFTPKYLKILLLLVKKNYQKLKKVSNRNFK